MRDSFSQGKEPVQDEETSAFGRLGENHGEATSTGAGKLPAVCRGPKQDREQVIPGVSWTSTETDRMV